MGEVTVYIVGNIIDKLYLSKSAIEKIKQYDKNSRSKKLFWPYDLTFNDCTIIRYTNYDAKEEVIETKDVNIRVCSIDLKCRKVKIVKFIITINGKIYYFEGSYLVDDEKNKGILMKNESINKDEEDYDDPEVAEDTESINGQYLKVDNKLVEEASNIFTEEELDLVEENLIEFTSRMYNRRLSHLIDKKRAFLDSLKISE